MNSLIIFTLLVSVVCVFGQGGHGGFGGGLGGGFGGGHHHSEEYVDFRAHPHYKFDYAVHDPKHHDVKDQWEVRDGEKTRGMYSLLQPDGRKRIVEYEATKHGINYHVKYEGHALHEEGHRYHGGGGGGGGGGGFGGHLGGLGGGLGHHF